MSDTVIIKPIVGTSTETKWQNNELAVAWRKFTGREQEQPIDQSPDRGSGWMKK